MNKSTVLLIAVSALVIYLFATKDTVYVPLREKPQPTKSKKNVINYYAWKGPFFTEDFQNFQPPNNRLNELVPTGKTCCEIPKYNMHNEDVKECHRYASDYCRIPSLTAENCWRNEWWNCTYRMRPPNPKTGDPGNYAQCTNNNLDTPNNLKSQCHPYFMDYSHPRDKISPKCYANTMKACLEPKIEGACTNKTR